MHRILQNEAYLSFAVVPQLQSAADTNSDNVRVMELRCPLQVVRGVFRDIKSIINTHLSRVAARMYFPLGENFTNDTGGLSSSDVNTNTGAK